MSDENVGGLVELLPCPFCGEPPKASAPWMFCGDVKQIASCNGTDSKPHELISMESHRWNTHALSAHGQPVVGEARPMDTYVSGLALIWMPEFDHYAAGWWKGSVISGITRLQTPFVQDDKQLWLEMTDMQPLGWMPLPEPPTFLTGPTP